LVSRGDIEVPYTPAELEEKFLSLVTPVYGAEEARTILDRTKRIESFDDIRAWTEKL
jgi:hypothetical protein